MIHANMYKEIMEIKLQLIEMPIVKPSPKSSPLRPKPKPRPVLNQNQSPIRTGVTL